MPEPELRTSATKHASPSPSPVWIRALGGLALALMGAGLLYALAIGLANAGRIGV